MLAFYDIRIDWYFLRRRKEVVRMWRERGDEWMGRVDDWVGEYIRDWEVEESGEGERRDMVEDSDGEGEVVWVFGLEGNVGVFVVLFSVIYMYL
jgi:hypothetical protein